jgi:uncharacterized membrane protein
MRVNKLTTFWHEVRDSLWFTPALLTLAGALLAVVMVEIDHREILPDADDLIWLHTGSADGAREVVSAIAAGLITVTGVVFSVTIVALQLASTQYTPRVLRNFTSDRPNQVVLGVFIGTFTYALLVLRVVRGDEPVAVETGDYFIPHLAVAVAVLLTLVSIGFLIFFINHLARSIQATHILERVKEETLQVMERRVPEQLGVPADDDVDSATPAGQGTIVAARGSGYIQAIDQEAVFKLPERSTFTVRLERDVGEFVLPGTTLATVWPAVGDDGDAAGAIRESFVLGPERTPYMDVERGVIELVDIALKGLSPSVNDPTTATLSLDRLAEVLLAFAQHDVPGRVRRKEGNGCCLIVRRTEFDRLADVALDQIRHFGVGNPRFAMTMLNRLGELGRVLPADRKQPIARHAAAVLRDAHRRIDEPADLRMVEIAAGQALASLGVGEPQPSR